MALFSCKYCNETSHEYRSHCPSCGNWNCFNPLELKKVKTSRRVLLGSGVQEKEPPRLITGLIGVDSVLGGGMVQDSLVLLGGEPGVGKSTLILEVIRGLLKKHPTLSLLYASGEESLSQIQSRARRLGVKGEGRAYLLCETEVEEILDQVKESKAGLLILDSIQTMMVEDQDSPAGSPNQMKDVAALLMKFAKVHRVAVILIGHVTKEGELAGPKVVEHLVDAVLSFEESPGTPYRRLRATKNRFGSTQVTGFFEMTATGLSEIEKDVLESKT
jgi:DNA repair protein RadA/Sms